MPAISIILPLYNGERYIRHAIAAVRSQTFQDWELLVINDGSTDHSGAIALQESQKDRRIRIFQKPNGGISSARNYGLAKAAGTYLAFADQDDTVGKNWLAALYQGMAGDMDLAVAGKRLEVLDASGRITTRRVCTYPDTVLQTEAEIHAFVFNQKNDMASLHIWNCLYKKQLIDANGIRFDENLSMGMEDVLFNICYGYYCRKIHKIPQVVYAYKQRIGISTSTKYNRNLAGEYAHRMEAVSRLFGFPSRTDAYRMYKYYALRELCNLYFRNSGPDSKKLLAELRDAYVKYTADTLFCRKRHCVKTVLEHSLRKRIFYCMADASLRKEKYGIMKIMKYMIFHFFMHMQ